MLQYQKYKRFKNHRHSYDDPDEIDKLRKEMGLDPIKRGMMNCLSCDGKFYSEDKKKVKTCLSCRRQSSDRDVDIYSVIGSNSL